MGTMLVTGPSGNVGDELVTCLASQPSVAPWRVASRHPDDLRDRLSGSTAEVVELDFFDRSTWSRALSDVGSLFLLFPLPGNRAARGAIIPFVEAAQLAGCRHVVYVSVFGADRARFIPHYKVESALRSSAMTWTVLRCGFFMQNLHRKISTHGEDIANGELFIPAGRGRTTLIDARDAAAVAALALNEPDDHRNAVYHLTGTAPLTMAEVASALTAELGFPVVYTNPGLIRFASRLRQRDVGWDTIGFMSAVYTLTRFGRNQQVTGEVQRLLGRPPCSLAEFLHHSAWRWRERVWT
jgi:uncharacterized protein YbjT (DUF2867 family)